MKSVSKENSGPQYPRLERLKDGTFCEVVILFTHDTVGIVIHHVTGPYPVGHRSTDWTRNNRTLYDGEITLSN